VSLFFIIILTTCSRPIMSGFWLTSFSHSEQKRILFSGLTSKPSRLTTIRNYWDLTAW
jgi:hypothetical protein